MKKKIAIWLCLSPLLLLLLIGAGFMAWDMISGIPSAINNVIHPKHVETTCETLLRTMKPSDEGYDAMVDACLGQP
jgi:hypothetical protein